MIDWNWSFRLAARGISVPTGGHSSVGSRTFECARALDRGKHFRARHVFGAPKDLEEANLFESAWHEHIAVGHANSYSRLM
jgi:hypothetical protein